MGAPTTIHKVLEQFSKNANQVLHASTISEATGLTRDQIQTAVTNLRTRHNLVDAIEVVVAGNAWIYKPHKITERVEEKATSKKRVFEEIGTTREGHLVIQADDGKLYRAEQL